MTDLNPELIAKAADAIDGRRHMEEQVSYIAFPPRNPKPGDEFDIYELGEPEPRRVPGWIVKWNERNDRLAANEARQREADEWEAGTNG